ncbi:MAG: sodium:proton antiporter [Prevotella sp.]|nr:sodium:proton antiporter [Prevotella sp.]
MTLILVAILILSFVLIATERITNVNKAAVAIFAGTVGWVLYICWGNDFVVSQHDGDYVNFLNGAMATSSNVKQYIAENIFLKYVGRAAEIMLFLLATMNIVEILQNNGCFDYLTQWIRTRHAKKMLWMLGGITFLISANLDNVTTSIMMLVVMRSLVHNRRQRLVYGSAIVLAANCGGALTVIGDPIGLVLWNQTAVTASNFSFSLLVPCIIAWALPTWWIGRMLPERIDIEWYSLPYRGDDTNLNLWQRLVMLIVGIGGLWFIPTFHNITHLSPFLGALCVLSVLWVVNEVFNRKLNDVDKMADRRMPRTLQYGVIQMMLFVLGIMLAISVVQETGAIRWLAGVCDEYIHSVWIMSVTAGAISSVLDNFATAMSFISFYPLTDVAQAGSDYLMAFTQNGVYWKAIAYAAAVGGNIFIVGSMSGITLMKSEGIRMGWYFRNVGWMAMVGALAGLGAMRLIQEW